MAGLKFDITGDNGNMLSALEGVQNGVRQTQKVVEQSGSGIEDMFGKMRSAATAVVGAFSAQQFASKVLSVRGEFQQLEVAFTTMLGSASDANALMDQLVKTAASTPFDLQGVANGAKQLLAYGIEADKVNETIVRLGDIAAGLSIPLNDLVYLYGTTMVQGRMFTQDLRQFQGRGVPIAEELAKQFGVAKEKVGELVTAGKVGSEEFTKAIVSMTSEGGKFAGLMAKQSHTISGQISNIEDAIGNMFNEIGKQNEGLINTGLKGVSYLVEHWESIGKVVLEVAIAYGTYKAALLAVYAAHKAQAIFQTVSAFFSLAKSIHTAKDAMILFNMTSKANPIGLIVSVIASAAAAFYLFGREVSAAKKAQESLNKIKEEANAKLADEKNKIELLLSVAKNETRSIEDRRKAVQKLNEIIPNYNAQLDTTTKKYIENKSALDGYLKSLVHKYEVEGAKELIGKLSKQEAELKVRRVKLTKDVSDTEKLATKIVGTGGFRAVPTQAETSLLTANTSIAKGKLAEVNKALNSLEDQKKLVIGVYGKDLEDDALGKTSSNKTKKSEQSEQSIKEQKKALQAELDALSYKEAVGKKGIELRKRIRALEKKEEVYSSSYGIKKEKGKSKEKLANETTERRKEIDEYKKTVLEKQKETELALRQQNIDLKEESYEKEIEQINLNYDRSIAENEKRRKDMIEALKDNKVNEWLNKNPKATKTQEDNYRKSLNLTDKNLNETQKAQLKDYENIAETQRLNAQKDLSNKLLNEFQNFEAKRTKINADFDKKRKNLEALPANTTGREEAIAELERKRKESIKSVNDEEVSKMRESSTLLIDLFGDVGEKSTKEIRKIISSTEELLSYLKNTKTDDITAKFGFTSEELVTLKSSPEQIKDIAEQLKKLKDAAMESNPFKQLAEDLKKLFSKKNGDKGDSTEARLKKLGKSASETADLIGGIANKLSAMFEAAGNTDIADSISGISDVMTSVSNVAKGFAQGGIIGGIMAGFGEVIGFVTTAFQAGEVHAEALKKIQQEIIAQQNSYNLALHEQNLEFEKSNTIFGKLDHKKATNAISVIKGALADLSKSMQGTFEEKQRVSFRNYVDNFNNGFLFDTGYKSSLQELKEQYAGLADIEIKTGHRKGNIFRKAKDYYGSLLDSYPDLIDSAGNFNKTLAESIVNTRQFTGDGKERLQYMIDLYKKVEEAEKQIKDYLTGIFGELGSNMSDALVDAFKNGTDAGKAFGESISKMLESIGKKMIFQTLFSDIIDKANEKMLSVMKNDTVSEDYKFDSYVRILDNMTSQVLGRQNVFNDLMNKYQSMASAKGVELFKNNTSEEQKATANGVTSITYEQANNIVALTTAGNISRDQIKDIAMTATAYISSLAYFSSSTNSAVLEIRNLMIYNNSYLEDILKCSKSIYNDFSQKIDDVNKNLKEMK